MKPLFFLILVTVASADWTPKPQQQLKQERVNCMKEVNLSQEMKEKVKRLEYPDNEMIKDFILCGARAYELWSDSKGWMTERIMILSDMKEEDVRQSIDACLDDNSQGSALNDWAYRNFLCMVKSDAKKVFGKIMGKID